MANVRSEIISQKQEVVYIQLTTTKHRTKKIKLKFSSLKKQSKQNFLKLSDIETK